MPRAARIPFALTVQTALPSSFCSDPECTLTQHNKRTIIQLNTRTLIRNKPVSGGNPLATATDKLAESLQALKALQDRDIVAIRSADLSRTHRERLVRQGFLQEVMKGWYIPTSPDNLPGDSTPWYTSFWKFIATYLDARVDGRWCLSPELSLSIHAGNWTVPKQLLVRAEK